MSEYHTVGEGSDFLGWVFSWAPALPFPANMVRYEPAWILLRDEPETGERCEYYNLKKHYWSEDARNATAFPHKRSADAVVTRAKGYANSGLGNARSARIRICYRLGAKAKEGK